jgi:xylulokinase
MLGRVCPYFSTRFGFRPETAVVVGSGDNPCSLAGLGLIGDTRTRAVSLGTSDTFFGYMPELTESGRTEGHVFGSADGRYMFLVCFKNGSLAREKIKNEHGLSWTAFSDILLETPAGNHGRILLPYFQPEITPRVLEAGARRYGGLAAEDVRGNVRAVAEAQAMSMFLHSGWTGRRPETLLVTAGGSENVGLLTVIAQVFGAEVRSLEIKDSAALGAALRAAHAWLNRGGPAVTRRALWESAAGSGGTRVVRSSPGDTQIFQAPGGLIDVFAACREHALGRGRDPGPCIQTFRDTFPDS